MSAAFDNRIFDLQISLQNGEIVAEYNQDFYIIASGTRYSNGNFGECALRIDNISKTVRDYLINKTTQWAKNRQNAIVSLKVGRESYGTFQLFYGSMISANVTQPPDIGLTFYSMTGAAQLGFSTSVVLSPTATLQSICQQVANNISSASPSPVVLDFQSKFASKNVGNYRFSGGSTAQINKLMELADIQVYQENGKLVVRDTGIPRSEVSIEINSATGMIGVPEITDVGVRVKMLIKNDILIYSPVVLTSILNPMANGNFYVYKIGFEVASRDTPFYWILDLRPAVLGAP